MTLEISSYLLSFISLSAAYIKLHGTRTVSPLTFFFVIYFMYAGPHVFYFIFFGSGLLATNLSSEDASTLLYCLTISNIGMIFAPIIYKSVLHSVLGFKKIEFIGNTFLKSTAYLAICIALLFTITLILMDSTNLQRLRDTISAILGNSAISIQQVRRELHVDTISNQIILRCMYFLTGPTLIILLFFAVTKRLSFLIRIACILAFIFLYLFGFVNTHKQTWLYPFFGTAAAILILWAVGNEVRSRRLLFLLLISPFFIVASLTVAYQIQYFSYNSDFFYWFETAAFRVLGQIETSALAIRLYSDPSMFIGLSGMGPIADISGVPRRDPTAELPIYFLENGKNTSLQGGFLMTGWAVAGFFGVAIASLIVSATVAFASAVTYTIRCVELRACVQAAVALSSWTFTQLNVSTALLTGGNVAILATIFFLAGLERAAARRKSVFLTQS